MSQLHRLLVESQQSGATSNQTPFMNQPRGDSISISERQVVATELAPRKSTHVQKLNLNARDVERSVHAQGIGQIVFPEKGPEWTTQITSQNTPQSVQKITPYSIEGRGSKREHFHIGKTNSCKAYPLGSLTDEYHQNGSIPGAGYSETRKRNKTENGIQTNTHSISSFVAKVKYPGDWYFHSMALQNLPKQCISPQPHLCLELMGETNGSTQVQNSLCPTTIETSHRLPQNPLKTSHASDNQLQPKTCSTEMSRIQQVSGGTVPTSIPSEKGKVPQGNKGCLERTSAAICKEKRATSKADFLLYNRTNHIPDGGPPSQCREQENRKQRAKCTCSLQRRWQTCSHMMEASEGLEGTDKGKEQWWGEERKVFHGRVDSFIARMHLVQGDRGFSKWKGSVVDSVIGVFLTQNVSDHLSSSAFMSLASLFPLKVEELWSL
ncbi:hypothetical protein OIU84_020086 [Salix udensis]|uniref:Uncharacterized protein n=1 Tax=Salix udensis TaxID=889485 RepID=A0AAD6L0F4_9ROSI|nr:hypothetical protein OIU84_020086 [Salix udensis]